MRRLIELHRRVPRTDFVSEVVAVGIDVPVMVTELVIRRGKEFLPAELGFPVET